MPHSSSKRALFLGATSVVLVASALFSASASAYVRASVADEGEVYLYWGERRIHYIVHEAGSSDVPLEETIGAVQRAFFSWASPSCTDIYFIYDGLSPVTESNLAHLLSRDPDGQNLVIWREDWPPPGADGGSLTADMISVTRLVFVASTGEIIDGDIDLNGYDHAWSTSETSGTVAYDIQSVITHEVGHLIGLGFSDEIDAVMYTAVREGDISGRQLYDDDEDGVCWIYPFGAETPGKPDAPPAVVGAGGGCCSTAGGGEHATSSLLLAFLLIGAQLWRRRASR